MDTIADKMMELRKNNETHKFMLFRGRYSPTTEALAYGTIPRIFGSPNNISHSAICAEAEKFGPFYTEGLWGYRDYDLARTKYLVIWGCDPISSNRQVPNTINKFSDILDRGTIAVVDPRFTPSAAKAQEWVPVKRGEDGALATALAHVILVEGLWSREFVGHFKEGKNLFKASPAAGTRHCHVRPDSRRALRSGLSPGGVGSFPDETHPLPDRPMRTILLFLAAVLPATAVAQVPDTSFFRSMQWKNIGPYRGGRSLTVSGSPSRPGAGSGDERAPAGGRGAGGGSALFRAPGQRPGRPQESVPQRSLGSLPTR